MDLRNGSSTRLSEYFFRGRWRKSGNSFVVLRYSYQLKNDYLHELRDDLQLIVEIADRCVI